MLAVFSIITALLCVPDITGYAINGLLQRSCHVSGVAGYYNTHEEVDRLVTGLQRIHRLWDNREALWLYCRIKKNCCVIFTLRQLGREISLHY